MAVWERPDAISRYSKEYATFKRRGGVVLNKIHHDNYDIAVMTFVLETICPEFGRRKLLSEAHQMVRKGGRLVMGIRASYDVKTARGKGKYCEIGGGYITPLRTFIKPYDMNALSDILKATQFEVEKVYNQSPILNVVARAV